MKAKKCIGKIQPVIASVKNV